MRRPDFIAGLISTKAAWFGGGAGDAKVMVY
jgi:hypothetical protein